MKCTRMKLKANNGKNCGMCGWPVDVNGHCKCEVHK